MLVEKLRFIFLKAFQQNANGFVNLGVDNSSGFSSVPNTLIGEQTGTTVLTPTSGNRIVVKGLTLSVSTGFDAFLKRSSDDEVILPVYGSNFTKGSTSSSLNITLDIDETLYVDTDGAGASDETFVGISYIELDE